MDKIQPLIIGGSNEQADAIVRLLGERAGEALRLGTGELETTGWQRRRKALKVWAVMAIGQQDDARDVDVLVNWTNIVRVSFRPARLVVLLPDLSMESVLRVARAGADGVLSVNATAEEIARELGKPGLDVSEYFPDPHSWLHSLQHASEQMLLSTDVESQAMRLLRIFSAQLKVARSRVVLRHGTKAQLIAGIGLPEDEKIGMAMPDSPPTLTHWVMDQRRARLVEAGMHGAPAIDSDARSSISVPLIAKGEVLGAVTFSSLLDSRPLMTADLAASEVFGSLLALSITNSRLHQENVHAERLAAIGSTTASISHCMKNMLMVLRGSTSLLRAGWDHQDDSEINDGLEMIERAARRLESIVFDLLDYAKERPALPQATEPGLMVAMLRDSVAILCRDRNIELEVRSEMLPPMLLDQNRMHRALMNLVSNAMDATGSGGRIIVTERREDSDMVFLVEDDGPGVGSDEASQIFEAFYSTKGSKGTGLGLAMVQKCCEEHGGCVNARVSEELGGLCVEMRIPYVPADESALSSAT